MRFITRVSSFLPLAVAAALVTPAAGCDGALSTRVPVRGKVCYRGVPLAAGLIVFTPDPARGCRGPLCCAEVQPDGVYELRTENAPGVPAGWYRVTVAACEAAPAAPTGPHLAIPRSLLPEKYRDPELSGLLREVKAGMENVLNFDLE